jgi:alpha-beta hydrolase superfamily lysophospholipase
MDHENYKKRKGAFRSSCGLYNTVYYIYTPIGVKPVGVVQIVHGMCEYIERYEDFIDFLCSNGYIVCGNDNIGHGASVNTADDFGYFGEKNGWKYLVKDAVRLTRMIRGKYSGLPYYILGHSMGSLIVRTLLTGYSHLYSGALILGTISLSFGTDFCLAVIESAAEIKGSHYRSAALDKLLFGVTNARIKDRKTEYDWVTSDKEILEKYASDPRCTFTFTARGMYDLVMLVKYVSSRGWTDKVPERLPVFIAGGSDDPVGRYGKCPAALFNRLRSAGFTDAELHIYPRMRHEILNEIDRRDVYDDILRWLNAHCTWDDIIM